MSLGADILSWVPGSPSPTEGPKLSTVHHLLHIPAPQTSCPPILRLGPRSPLPGSLLMSFSNKTHPSPSTHTWCPACSPSSISAPDTCPPSVDTPRRCPDGQFMALPPFNQEFLKDLPGIAHLGPQPLVQLGPEQVPHKHLLSCKGPGVAAVPNVQPTSLCPSTWVSSQPPACTCTCPGFWKAC